MKFDLQNIRDLSSRAEVFLLDLVFPIECLACGASGRWICSDCFRRIRIKDSQSCFGCGRENLSGRFCRSCRNDRGLDGIWLAADYEQALVASAIKNLKYSFVKDLSVDLAKILTLFIGGLRSRRGERHAPKILSDLSGSLIMPVPLHQRRLRWRGFNQAELIAGTVAQHLGCRFAADILVRRENTEPQAKLAESERQSNIKNCFALADRAPSIENESVILIDDVITTGATIDECAKVLKKAGAREVWGLAVAKG